jgi:leucyl aminopeptidase
MSLVLKLLILWEGFHLDTLRNQSTAALYLERFVPESQNWMHLDTYAWNDGDRPGHPRGGEAQGLRAFFKFLSTRYS